MLVSFLTRPDFIEHRAYNANTLDSYGLSSFTSTLSCRNDKGMNEPKTENKTKFESLIAITNILCLWSRVNYW